MSMNTNNLTQFNKLYEYGGTIKSKRYSGVFGKFGVLGLCHSSINKSHPKANITIIARTMCKFPHTDHTRSNWKLIYIASSGLCFAKSFFLVTNWKYYTKINRCQLGSNHMVLQTYV